MDGQIKGMFRVWTRCSAAAAGALWLVAGAQSGRADVISSVSQFKNIASLQTGNGNTLSGNGTFFSTDLTSNDGTFTTVTMTYPGAGSPVSLTSSGPVDYLFQTPSLADKATMDAAFPFGTYQVSASGSGTGSTSYSYAADDYAQANPFLTGTDYSSLQGMDPSHPFTFHLSPYTNAGTPAFSFIFLTVFDFTKGQTVFNQGFLAPSTTSVVMPGNTLAFGDSFSYEVDYSNRDLVASPGATFDAQLGFDLRTDGTFSSAQAAAPEPSGMLLAACGLLAGWAARRRMR